MIINNYHNHRSGGGGGFRVGRFARGFANVGSAILTGSGLTMLIFLWAMTSYAFSRYFDFTGQFSVFIAHDFVDLWGNEKTIYTLDIWGGFAPMVRNVSLSFNMLLDIPKVPNLGNWFNFTGGDWLHTLLAIFNVITLGFPMVIRVVLYLVEIGIWMIKVTTIVPLCFVFSLAGGVLDDSTSVTGFGGTLLSWFNFSFSGFLGSLGL